MSEPSGNGSAAVKDQPHVTPSFEVKRQPAAISRAYR